MKQKPPKNHKPAATTLARRVAGLSPSLVSDVRKLIESARERVAAAVNSELTLLYWQIGKRIREDILGNERAIYGKKIVHALSAQLMVEFGPGYTPRNVFNMVRFTEVFPDQEIVHALRVQLSWTHIRLIIYVEDPLAREFYSAMAQLEHWSTRTLEDRINSLLFERTALSKKPEKLITKELKSLRQNGQLTPDLVFRDPYFLDFLGLHVIELPPRALLERKLHDAIQLARQQLDYKKNALA
jgi:hypothetical protein